MFQFHFGITWAVKFILITIPLEFAFTKISAGISSLPCLLKSQKVIMQMIADTLTKADFQGKATPYLTASL